MNPTVSIAFQLPDYNPLIVFSATVLLGIASGCIGSFLLLRKRSLMGDALSHATLPGIGIAFAVMIAAGGSGKHLGGLLLGAAISGLLGVFVMYLIRNTTRLRDDVAMGLVLSVFFGVGVAILGMVQTLPNAAGLEAYIYGRPASIILSDLVWIGIMAGITLLATGLLYKELTLLCFDEHFGRAQGWPVGALDLILLGLVTAITVVGLQAVGLILIIALLITPPSAARFWTHDLSRMMQLSAMIGGFSGGLGSLISSRLPDMPAGAVIVLVAATIFLISMIFAPARGVLVRRIRRQRLRQKVDRQHLLRAAYELLESESKTTDQLLPIGNHPLPFQSLLAKRTWSRKELTRIARTAIRRGDLERDASDSICLSEAGFGEAARITRNHRLWEVYLVTHADIAPSHVDRDADMVEHILEADLVRKLEQALQRNGDWVPQPDSLHQL
ncbi:MAG: iron chelate uptake ABC transporter family permease subunit [Verrucomicrobiales bacterium]